MGNMVAFLHTFGKIFNPFTSLLQFYNNQNISAHYTSSSNFNEIYMLKLSCLTFAFFILTCLAASAQTDSSKVDSVSIQKVILVDNTELIGQVVSTKEMKGFPSFHGLVLLITFKYLTRIL
jgi:hypothetical protein